MSNGEILLIEDDLSMQKLIAEYLHNFGFGVTALADPKEALDLLASERERFDAVVLDLMLPGMDGFDVGRRIKELGDIPIIISSARGDIGNKIHGFEIGVDDYLAKPYEPRELVLRLEALLRRYRKSGRYRVGEFTVDETSRELWLQEYPIELTKIEYEIFLYLLKHRGSVLSREQIIHAVGLPPDTRNRSIDMHISNIRQKIGDNPKEPRYIRSVWGIGYKFIAGEG
ncbi:response regulator transcription factor [Hydrogenimonas sp.]